MTTERFRLGRRLLQRQPSSRLSLRWRPCGGASSRRRCRSFADQFCRHDAGHEELGTMIVEVHGGALTVGGGDDAQSIYFMLDSLTFCHCLHDVLLDSDWKTMRKTFEREPRAGAKAPESLARGW